MSLPINTPEARQKARAALNAKIAEGAKFKRGWLDAPVWEKLASKSTQRLPAWWVAATPSALKRALGIRHERQFRAIFGCSPSRLIELNPTTPLRVFVGQMLELTE
jgi:hypothetical protein